MTILKVLTYPNPTLRKPCEDIPKIDASIQTLIDDMFDTMHSRRGIGLAAPQVGANLNLYISDLTPDYSSPKVFINPKIVARQGSIVWEEGCLSVPGYTDKVTRAEHIEIEALNRDGEVFRLEAAGLYAVALQHEMDHLDGKVFVQYLSRLKRDSVKRKMNKIKKSGIDDGVEAAANL